VNRNTGIAAAAVIGLTAAGLAVGGIDPRLAARTAPHPALTGSLSDALGILQNNLRVLAAPYLLGILGFPRHRVARRAGDLLVLALAAGSTVPVGIELARWRGRLLPYLPQLPVEWAALTVSVSAWLLIRTMSARYRQIVMRAAVSVALLAVAAGLETWCTPRRSVRTAVSQTAGGVRDRACLVGGGGGWRPALCAAAGPRRCKVARSLSLALLGSARPPGRR